MKKYVRVFLVIVIFFLIVNFLFSLFSSEKVVNYRLGNFDIKEYYLRKDNKYYFEVSLNDKLVNFMVNNNFDEDNYIVDEIHYFENSSYVCILPVFEDKHVYTDILCLHDNVIYPYRSLVNKNLELDGFAEEMKEYGYKVKLEQLDIQNKNTITVYNKNLDSSHVLVMPSYTGVYLIDSRNDSVKSINLFSKDIYDQSINCLVSDYYLVADYSQAYSFHEFYLVNLKNNKVSTIASNNLISTNSYIQGVVDDLVYLIDRSNKKQYVIDVSNNSISVVGNIKKGIMYYDNGEFINKSMYDAIDSELIFKFNYLESNKYDFVYNNNGIYYSYKLKKDNYDIYISYEKLPDVYTYGLNINNINKVKYSSEYIYYIDKDYLYSYSLNDGVRPLLKYMEFLYNDNLKFYIYEK